MNEIDSQKKEEIQKAINDEFWDLYTKNSSTLSSICRQLSFAEGGICWLFLKPGCPGYIITPDVIIILIFLVLFFIFDACQYLSLANNNKFIALLYEKKLEEGKLKDKKDVTRPSWINYSASVCFVIKLCCIGVSSFLLIAKFLFQFFLF